ncbi:MAG: DUF1761 domain-containing protein, partial [Nanoarchaeota archaeon]|nr:DUF1761 domain-containing protein [Nanoarchaeota archaeon]
VSINYLAVLVAAIAQYALGALWYSVLFGKQWMKLNGMEKMDPKKMEEMKKGVMWSYAGGLVSSLVMAYVLAHFVDYTEAATAAAGAVAGFWIWLGFIATVTLGMVLWENKPFKLYLLNNAYNLLGLVIMGAILAVWV